MKYWSWGLGQSCLHFSKMYGLNLETDCLNTWNRKFEERFWEYFSFNAIYIYIYKFIYINIYKFIYIYNFFQHNICTDSLIFLCQIPPDHTHFLVLSCVFILVTTLYPKEEKKIKRADHFALPIFSVEHGDILLMDCSTNRIDLFPSCTPSTSQQLWRCTFHYPTPFKIFLQCLPV